MLKRVRVIKFGRRLKHYRLNLFQRCARRVCRRFATRFSVCRSGLLFLCRGLEVLRPMIKSLAMPAFHEQHFVAGVTDDFPRGVRYVPAKQPLDEVFWPNAFD